MMQELTKPQLINFDEHTGKDGGVINVSEIEKTLPFTPKRIYWCTQNGQSTETKGAHANKSCAFVIVSLKGTCNIELVSQNGEKQLFEMDTPAQGLYVPKAYWRNIQLCKDSVVLSIASETYDTEDLISSLEEFMH